MLRASSRLGLWPAVWTLFVGLAGSRADEPAGAHKVFRAGAAAVDVTPTAFPVLVSGSFESRSADRAVDPLFARALVLDDGATRLAIVVVDSLMLPRELLDEAKALAARSTGIPPERMLVSATHTHSAAAAMGCLGTPPDPAYPAFLLPQIARAIQLANDALQPARIGWSSIRAPEHTFNRRWIYRPDRMLTDPFGQRTVRANMHPGYLNPAAIGPSGPVDDQLSLLALETPAGKPLAVLANFSMHYVGSPMVSADYFGRFVEKLARRLAGDSPPPMVAMSQGTSGDLMWMNYGAAAKPENYDVYAAELVEIAERAYRQVAFQDWVPLAMAESRLALERRVPSAERLAWARQPQKAGLAKVYAQEQLFLNAEPRRELKLQAVRIGELGIAAIPNETFALTGLKLKAQSPLSATFNIELANGAEGYIPPPEQHKLGGYTTWPARSAGLEVEAEPNIVEALLKLFEQVAGRPRRAPADPAGAYADAVMASKPIAFWRLADMRGPTAADAGGADHPAVYEDGVALFLDGPTADGLSPPSSTNRAAHFAGGRLRGALEKLGDDYTVEFWFWNGLEHDARPVTGYLFSRGPEGDAAAPGDHLGIGGQSIAPGQLFFFSGNRANQIISGKQTLALKTWHHVAFVRTGSRVAVYLNGQPEPELAGEAPVTRGADAPLFFAGRSDGFANFEGKLDEIAVFDRALTTGEIVKHRRAAGAPAPGAPADAPDADVGQRIEAGHTAAQAAAPAADDAHGLRPDPPRSPAESLRALRVRPGFEIEQVAAEPLVLDPVALAWGPDGRLWVVEMADYPLGLDGKMRSGGRIRTLIDSDGDGRYDRSTLFMESVNFPTGIAIWRDGVIVTAAPEIFYAADTDGDGRADKRETLYSGFIEGNPQLRVNGLQPGLDGWLYCANGWSGGAVRSEKTGATVDIRGRDLRIEPDQGLVETQSGVTEFGRNRDDWGCWFGCDNSNPLFHFVLDDYYLRRNPHIASPDPKRQLMAPPNPRVFALSRPQKRYHTFDQSGRFTSACGAMIYRDRLLFGQGPEEHAFVCEPVHNLVHHEVLTADGGSFTARRADAEAESELLASDDQWFRPVSVWTGPDGALWVVDMYRYMIEHPDWLPAEGKAELAPYYRLGEDMGRIYRIFPAGKRPGPAARLAGLDTGRLVAALDSPNGWQRDTAQQQLVWKADRAAIAPLEQLAAHSSNPLVRLHALATLAGLKALKADILIKALADPHPGVRREAVRLAEPLGAGQPALVAAAARLTADADVQVRQQLAYTLGAWPGAAAGAALGELAVAEPLDPLVQAALLSSVTKEHARPVLKKVFAARRGGLAVGDVFDQLLGLAVAYELGDLVLEAFDDLLAGGRQSSADARWTAVARLLDALEHRGTSLEKLGDGQTAAARLASLEALFDAARHAAVDAEADPGHRAVAVSLLGRQPPHIADDRKLLAGLLDPRTPAGVQSAAVARLAAHGDLEAAQVLLDAWPHLGPALRGEVTGALLSRKPWVSALLDRLESHRLAAADLDAAARARLTGGADPELVERARQLLAASGDASRQQVLERYAPAIALAGQTGHGKELFEKKCSQCHRLGNVGHEVGPNLASLTDKSPQSLLVALLDPSRAVETRYLNYVAVTADGRSLSGVLASETGSSITLLTPEGKQQVILRTDLEELKSTGKSLMPDGLEQDLAVQDIADLIAFVAGKSPGEKSP